MSRRSVSDLRDGEQIEEVFLLAEKQLRANRNGDLYLLTQLRDATGLVSGLLWNVTEDQVAGFAAGDYVKIRGKAQLFQGALQVILTHIQQASSEGLDAADFRPSSSQDVTVLLARLREILLAIEDEPIRTLMECFLVDETLMDRFSRAPAGVKTHHAYEGGLIEHVVNILETAMRIVDLYPQLDPSLLLAAIFLHDIGKVHELSYDATFAYTDEGQLIGHMVIAVEMLTAKAAEYEQMTGEPFPEEPLLRLKHMILSHHGRYEFGSPKLPMTLEAIALVHLDNLDAKINEFARSIDDDPNAGSNWTPYSPRLDRKLYKGAVEE